MKMKEIVFSTWCISALVIVLSFSLEAQNKSLLDDNGNPAGFQTLELGAHAPDFDLLGIDGKNYTLEDFTHADILMVLFTSNHCPTSHAIEERLKTFINDYSSRSFAMVAINPNHPDGLSIDELGYGEFSDSFEDMKPYAELNGWEFPYIYDGETQQVARAYGCLATPHVFLFDKERKLRYAGRFDDSRYKPEHTVNSPDARNAIEDLLAGREVAVPRTRPHGCSTKWREKRAKNVAMMESWKDLPVSMKKIGDEEVATLRSNSSGNYRLFNIWATWCVPCVEEFPDLVAISRQFDMRDFDFITISLDDPKDESEATAFLKRFGAGPTKRATRRIEEDQRETNHYIYSGPNQDALADVLDPEWPGPIPHTVLVAPGGNIVWRHNGIIDSKEARSRIAEALTRYWSEPSE